MPAKGKSNFEGKHHSPETIAQIKLANSGKGLFPQRAAVTVWNKGLVTPTRAEIKAQILIDPRDAYLLDAHSWSIDNGYAKSKIGSRNRRLHQLILEVPAGYMVDHINGNPLDNRRSNLRIATSMTNQQNRKVGQKNNTSGFKGVSWHSTKRKWHANIRVNKVLKHLGYYEEATQAAKAYNQAALTYFGSYAQLNEIPNGN